MNIIQRPSPNFEERKGDAKPSLIILHYTDMNTAEEAMQRLCDPASKVSAHYCINEDGAVYQHVDEKMRAWHAGQSFWRGQTDINSHSIGIELVNPGHTNGYRAFPSTQINALLLLCHDIFRRHDVRAHNVLAHSDVAPARKMDPGELFPWKVVAESGIGLWPEEGLDGEKLDTYASLIDFGYDPSVDEQVLITAFQRHYVPEVFTGSGEPGVDDPLTRSRLKGLIPALFA